MSYKITYDTNLAPPRAPALIAFMEDFYRTSDTESQHEKYVQSFTEDATLIMGPKQAQGADGMLHCFTGYRRKLDCMKIHKPDIPTLPMPWTFYMFSIECSDADEYV